MTLSGVAAVGSPLAGTVSVKDANGTIRSTPLGSNGVYFIDVAGLQAPFVLRAEGSANGHNYTVYSAAVAADVGNTINITQLTDLVVDNIAGQVASAYFDNGDFSSLTPTALAAELALLKSRLLPVLTALGVDASVDLLRSQFTPLASALDTALDVLRVSVDTTTHIATITNIVTQQQIQDAIDVPAAAEPTAPILDDTGNLDQFATDSAAIKAALAAFMANFATGLPSLNTVKSTLTDTFLSNDEDRDTLAADLVTDSSLIGASFTDIAIEQLDYSALPLVYAVVEMTLRDSNGVENDRVTDWGMRKDIDGVWRMHGNQRVLDVEVSVSEHLQIPNDCRSTGLNVHIEDNNSANNGGVINHIVVSGPGMPSGGLRFDPQIGGDWWGSSSQGVTRSRYVMADSCITTGQLLSDTAIASIANDAQYVFTAYTSTDNSAPLNFPSGAVAGKYHSVVERRPLTLAEVNASTLFPTLTAPTLTQLASYVSGPLTLTATGMNPNYFGYLQLFVIYAPNSNSQGADDWQPVPANGTLSTTLSLTPPASGDTVSFRGIEAETQDAFRREFSTANY